jgi:methylenetetrahydrofolate dehydrogenase (NADP+)/methenyltetrahydrofolate cyclohydrolase
MKVNGKEITKEIQKYLQAEFAKQEKRPVFSIFYVGSDPVIDQFISIKKRFGKSVGVDVVVHRFDEDISFEDLGPQVLEIVDSSDAAIVQLPLPEHLKRDAVTGLIPSGKDVDVLSPQSFEMFKKSEITFIPPVAGAVMHVLDHYNVDLQDKKIALVGLGRLVGMPTQIALAHRSIQPTIFDKESWSDGHGLQDTDIVISGVGLPALIKPDMVQDGVVLVDAGTSESAGAVVGDIDPACEQKSALFTPVPGGIGPITVAVLFENVLKAVQSK